MRYFGILLFLLGCSSARLPFEPAQRAAAYTTNGLPAAIYELVPQSARWGSARVSSRGIYRSSVEEGRRWIVHVALEVENTGQHPVKFSPTTAAVELVTETGVATLELERNGSSADAELAPGANRSFDLFYELPAEISPAAVHRYFAIWSLEGPNGYKQRTEFQPLVPRNRGSSYCDNRPFDDFCDPFFYGVPLYVHTVDYDDRPAPSGGGAPSGGSSGPASSPSSFPKPRSLGD